jgi:FHA domain
MSGEYDKQEAVPDTEPLAIEHFAQAARALEAEAFLARYGDRFLIHQGPLEPERRVKRPMRTAIMLSGGPLLDPGTPGPPPGADLLVFPLRQTGRSPYPRIITVGRTKNNDVVLPDAMISKFHALFKEADGKLLCQDADSRNGSFVDGKRAPTTKGGKGLEVGAGSRVKFGLLEFWFVSGTELQELARRSFP